MADSPSDDPPPSQLPPPPVLLAGPTAVGKSAIALHVAKALNGEIISVDSMQVYRGMDVGTAKPSPAERAAVPHHLIDVVGLEESFDASRFVAFAEAAVADIQHRGRVPILCGGTGLYFKAFLEGLGEAPASDSAVRKEIEATPVAELLRELAARDPQAYERIDRNNPRRVIRAVEVVRLTGKPFFSQRAAWSQSSPIPHPASRIPHPASRIPHPASRMFGLSRSPDDLRQRIDARIDAMFALGWVAETQRLLEHGLAENRTAMQALGYRQILEYLRGERSLEEAVRVVKSRTRLYAKRQMTWFRGKLQLKWLHLERDTNPETVAGALAEDLRRTTS